MNQMKRTCVWIAMLTVVLAMAASAVAQDKKDTGGGFPTGAADKKAAPAKPDQPTGDAGGGFPTGKAETKDAKDATGKDAATQPADGQPGAQDRQGLTAGKANPGRRAGRAPGGRQARIREC